MNIGIGNNFGTRHELSGIDAAEAKPAAAGATGGADKAPGITITAHSADPLLGSEPVAEVPDSAIRRDDALGKLISSAFNLPPPPMPAFAD